MYIYSFCFFAILSQVCPAISCPDATPINITASLKPGWKYIVQSPGYPDNYPPNTTCIWNITGPSDYHIYLIVEDFQIEPSRQCEEDYLVSASSWYSLQFQKSGRCSILTRDYIKSLTYRERIRRRKIVYSASDNLWLKFSSDGSSEFKGFQGEIRLAATGGNDDCESYLTAASGSFFSPKHPSPYSPGLYCTWNIAVPDGKKAKLKFTAFELGNTTNEDNDCINDYVEIREGSLSGFGEILGKYCGKTLPSEVVSPSNKMWVRFVSDRNYATVYKGFRAEFSGSTILTTHSTTCIILLLLNVFASFEILPITSKL